jgi:hypothetical protein
VNHGDLEAAQEHVTELREHATTMGSERYLAIALERESVIAAHRGDIETYETLSTEAIRMLRQLDDPFLLRALHNRTTRLIPTGRFEEGEATARELIDLAKHRGDLIHEAIGLKILGHICWYRGDLADAGRN